MRTSGLPAGDARQRPREQLEDLDPVLGLRLRAGAATRESPLTAERSSPISRELREEGDQVRREVREVGALGRGARRVAAAGSSPG